MMLTKLKILGMTRSMYAASTVYRSMYAIHLPPMTYMVLSYRGFRGMILPVSSRRVPVHSPMPRSIVC